MVQKQYMVDNDETIGVKCWDVGCGTMCCPKHHIPMTIYGGCKKCNKELINGADR